jgi:YfiH family protein
LTSTTIGGYRLVQTGDAGAVFLQSPLLTGIPGLVHGFASRNGGVSTGTFSSLNFGLKGGDSPDNVRRNLERLAAGIGFTPARFFRAKQVHESRILRVDRDSEPEQVLVEPADGLVTGEPGHALGVLTADCVPVLLVVLDEQGRARAIGSAHAGWRGVVSGVLAAVVERLVAEHGAARDELRAATGPCIGVEAYEVGPEVAERFEGIPGVVRTDLGPRPHLDLPAAVRHRLLEAGLRDHAISQPSVCTHSQPDLFFSYRRDGPQSGHQLSVIGLVG